ADEVERHKHEFLLTHCRALTRDGVDGWLCWKCPAPGRPVFTGRTIGEAYLFLERTGELVLEKTKTGKIVHWITPRVEAEEKVEKLLGNTTPLSENRERAHREARERMGWPSFS